MIVTATTIDLKILAAGPSDLQPLKQLGIVTRATRNLCNCYISYHYCHDSSHQPLICNRHCWKSLLPEARCSLLTGDQHRVTLMLAMKALHQKPTYFDRFLLNHWNDNINNHDFALWKNFEICIQD